MKERPLNPAEGKSLRYVVEGSDAGREPAELIVRISWSDLPKTLLEARGILERLRSWGYVNKVGKKYITTEKGRTRIRRANKDKEWNSTVRD